MSNDSQERYVGTVVFFRNKPGYGFLSWEKDGEPQKDMFVHFSDIQSEGFRTLKKDQKVSFAMGVNNKGEPKAVEVEVVEE